MTSTMTKQANREILTQTQFSNEETTMKQSITAKSSSRLMTAIRLLPATMLLAGALSFAPNFAGDAGATGCHVAPSSLRLNGGISRNVTTINAKANGGNATADARGGNDNLALGFFGNANAGNGGTADARANGGIIDLDNINSGNNVGNVIRTGSSAPCAGSWAGPMRRRSDR